jgi:hypothetical protein
MIERQDASAFDNLLFLPSWQYLSTLFVVFLGIAK